MTALEWFAIAAVLAAAGLALLAAARQGRPVFARVQPAERRTRESRPGVRPEINKAEISAHGAVPPQAETGPPTGDLFTPVVESTPDQIARHWRNREETP